MNFIIREEKKEDYKFTEDVIKKLLLMNLIVTMMNID